MTSKNLTRCTSSVVSLLVAGVGPLGCSDSADGGRTPEASSGALSTSGGTGGVPEASSDGGSEAQEETGDAETSGASPEPFEPPTDEVELLPFSVRMTNLALLLEIGTEHRIFSDAYALRLLLGDHDFSQQQAPDLRWSAERMYTWVRALKPICSSAVVHSKYPGLHEGAGAMMRDAYGRDPSVAELESVAQIVNSDAAADDKARLVCLTVLGSLDFVAY